MNKFREKTKHTLELYSIKVANSELPRTSGYCLHISTLLFVDDKQWFTLIKKNKHYSPALIIITSSVASVAVILIGGSTGYLCSRKIKKKGINLLYH